MSAQSVALANTVVAMVAMTYINEISQVESEHDNAVANDVALDANLKIAQMSVGTVAKIKGVELQPEDLDKITAENLTEFVKSLG